MNISNLTNLGFLTVRVVFVLSVVINKDHILAKMYGKTCWSVCRDVYISRVKFSPPPQQNVCLHTGDLELCAL